MTDLVRDLSERLAAASAVLGRLAEKDGRVALLLKYRTALERIAAEENRHAAEIAKEALRS